MLSFEEFAALVQTRCDVVNDLIVIQGKTLDSLQNMFARYHRDVADGDALHWIEMSVQHYMMHIVMSGLRTADIRDPGIGTLLPLVRSTEFFNVKAGEDALCRKIVSSKTNDISCGLQLRLTGCSSNMIVGRSMLGAFSIRAAYMHAMQNLNTVTPSNITIGIVNNLDMYSLQYHINVVRNMGFLVTNFGDKLDASRSILPRVLRTMSVALGSEDIALIVLSKTRIYAAARNNERGVLNLMMEVSRVDRSSNDYISSTPIFAVNGQLQY